MIKLEELFDEVRNYAWAAYDCGTTPNSSLYKEYCAQSRQRLEVHLSTLYDDCIETISYKDLIFLAVEMEYAYYRYGNTETDQDQYSALEKQEIVLSKLAEIYREIYRV